MGILLLLCGELYVVLYGVTHINLIRPVLENVSCVWLEAFLFYIFLGAAFNTVSVM